jgi:hypothetical protein
MITPEPSPRGWPSNNSTIFTRPRRLGGRRDSSAGAATTRYTTAVGDLYRALPPEGVKIALVLFLAFLLGLEREERKPTGTAYAFGGVRTFPLIGLI